MDAFEKIFSNWRTIEIRPPGTGQARYFLEDLTAPPSGSPEAPRGSWLEACQHLAAGKARDPDDGAVQEMWAKLDAVLRKAAGGAAGGNDLRKAASTMLECARAIRRAEGGAVDPAVWQALASSHFPLRTVWDTVAKLGAPPSGVLPEGDASRRILQLPAVLVRLGTHRGCSATLELELLGQGRGQFCPALEMALVTWDGDFVAALANARALLAARGLCAGRYDVRWRLTFFDGKKRPLQGGSLGAALAFGAAWLAAFYELVPDSPLVKRLRAVSEPWRLCFSGAVSQDGGLNGIGINGVAQKIQAAARDDRVAILIFPASALKGVTDCCWPGRSRVSPCTFVVKRLEPKAPGLAVVCVPELFQET